MGLRFFYALIDKFPIQIYLISMTKRVMLPLFSILTIGGILLSCESELYPPTDPPTLSNIVLTSDSYRDSTTTVREGDTVYVSVDVTDPEEDPETLNLSVLSGGSEVINREVSASRIFDGTTWETWFDSTGLATGAYSVSLTATDRDGNTGEAVTKDFSITADTRPPTSSGTGVITIDSATWVVKDTIPNEPFTITFSITNISSLTLDIVQVPFSAEDASSTLLDAATGTITSIDPGETKTGYVRLNIQLTQTCDHLVYSEASSEVIIY